MNAWGTPEQVAAHLQRPPRTIRSWYHRGIVKHRHADGRVEVWWPDAYRADRTRQRRKRGYLTSSRSAS